MKVQFSNYVTNNYTKSKSNSKNTNQVQFTGSKIKKALRQSLGGLKIELDQVTGKPIAERDPEKDMQKLIDINKRAVKFKTMIFTLNHKKRKRFRFKNMIDSLKNRRKQAN